MAARGWLRRSEPAGTRALLKDSTALRRRNRLTRAGDRDNTVSDAEDGRDAMADEYKHGEMDITENEKTFQGFIKFFVWLFGISIGILIFLALFNS